jgi:hypothetical protein
MEAFITRVKEQFERNENDRYEIEVEEYEEFVKNRTKEDQEKPSNYMSGMKYFRSPRRKYMKQPEKKKFPTIDPDFETNAISGLDAFETLVEFCESEEDYMVLVEHFLRMLQLIQEENILNVERETVADKFEEEMEDPELRKTLVHENLTIFLDSIQDELRETNALVMGSCPMFLINPDLAAPSDIDIWVSRTSACALHDFFEAKNLTSSFRPAGKNISPDIYRVTTYIHKDSLLPIQVIETHSVDLYEVAKNFDMNVAQAIWSPQFEEGPEPTHERYLLQDKIEMTYGEWKRRNRLQEDGVIVGLLATERAVNEAILAKKAKFVPRPWDLDENGGLTKRAVKRIVKYIEKGFEIDTPYEEDEIFEKIEALDGDRKEESGYYYPNPEQVLMKATADLLLRIKDFWQSRIPRKSERYPRRVLTSEEQEVFNTINTWMEDIVIPNKLFYEMWLRYSKDPKYEPFNLRKSEVLKCPTKTARAIYYGSRD